MTPRQTLVLRKTHSKLVEELDAIPVLDHMYEHSIISIEEYKTMKVKEPDEERVRSLLTVIPEKGQRAYEELLSFLSTNKAWLHQKLVEMYDTTTESRC